MTTTIDTIRAEAARFALPDVKRAFPRLPDAQAATLAQRRAETMRERDLLAFVERGRRAEARAPFEAKIRAANPRWPEHVVYANAERAMRKARPQIDAEVRPVIGAAPVVPMQAAKPAARSALTQHTRLATPIARHAPVASSALRGLARGAKAIANKATHPRVAAASLDAVQAAAARLSARGEAVHIHTLERELAR